MALRVQDAHSYDSDFTPSLVPVFDPTFTTPNTIVNTVSPNSTTITIPTTLEHHSGIPSSTLLISEHSLHDANPDDTPSFSDELPDIPGDLAAVDFTDWGSWDARHRVAAVRRWIIYASHKFGPVDRWAKDFSQEWGLMKRGETADLDRWLLSVKQRIRMGRCVLSYLEQAMEGELPAATDEWRDLYAQSHQLAYQLWGAVLSVQYTMDTIITPRLSTEY